MHVYQNLGYGPGAWALIDSKTNVIQNVTVWSGQIFDNNTNIIPSYTSGFPPNILGGHGVGDNGYSVSPGYYAALLIINTEYYPTRLTCLLSANYWNGKAVDETFFKVMLDWQALADDQSLFVVIDGSITAGSGGPGSDFLLGNSIGNALTGKQGNDYIVGGAGSDTLTGGDGKDTVFAGNGADLIVGGSGAGNDFYFGDAGSDTIKYASASQKVTVDLSTGLGSAKEVGIDKLKSIENITGGRGGDLLVGSVEGNRIDGYVGNDIIRGGDGSDRLIGGLGRDQMTGGADRDIFDFNSIAESGNSSSACDIVKDFRHLTDDIDVSTIDASTLLSGNNAFVWKGSGAFTASSAGELRFKIFDNAGTANDYTIVYGDTDKDTASEFQIQIKGLVSLTSSDFIL